MNSVLVFKVLVTDDRSPSTKKRYVVEAASRERARELAQHLLEESPHHLGVEVWVGDDLMLAVAQPTDERRFDGRIGAERQRIASR